MKSRAKHRRLQVNEPRVPKSKLPIVNMVFHGPWNEWVFASMLKEYQKYASEEFTIVPSRLPIPGCDIYQYWRPFNESAIRQFSTLSRSPNSPYFSRGVCMLHDSPYDYALRRQRLKNDPNIMKSLYTVPNRKPFRSHIIARFKGVLATSQEQVQAYPDLPLTYAPLGVFDKYKPRTETNLTDKLRLGWSGRLYADGVKNEQLLFNIAKRLDPKKYEFVISSPNALPLILSLQRLGFGVYSQQRFTHDQLMEKMDVLLITSMFEGTPLPLVEALAMGIPVFSTPVGEATALLTDTIFKEVGEFVTALNDLERNRELLVSAKPSLIRKVENRTWESHVQMAMRLWRRILGKSEELSSTRVCMLSWHDSIPRLLKPIYDRLPFTKYFLSLGKVRMAPDRVLLRQANSFRIEDEDAAFNKIMDLRVTHVMVWNGEYDDDQRGHQRNLILRLKDSGITVLHAEHGWFPQSQYITLDTQGTCGNSSFATSKQIPKVDRKQELTRIRAEYKKKINPFKRMTDSRFSGYLYVPLQLFHDNQITMYSPLFKDMSDFISHVAEVFPDEKLLFKGHPKDTRANLLKYKQLCDKIPNAIFVADGDNITYCANCKGMIAINSTCTNEALLFNKPIMTYGSGTFSGKGITYEIDEFDANREKLFLTFKPNSEAIDRYLQYLISRQIDFAKPNMKVVEEYFV